MVGLRMWHQAEYEARWVTNTGYVAPALVWRDRVWKYFVRARWAAQSIVFGPGVQHMKNMNPTVMANSAGFGLTRIHRFNGYPLNQR